MADTVEEWIRKHIANYLSSDDFPNTPEERIAGAVLIGLPREWLDDSGYVKIPEYEDAFVEFCQKRFG